MLACIGDEHGGEVGGNCLETSHCIVLRSPVSMVDTGAVSVVHSMDAALPLLAYMLCLLIQSCRARFVHQQLPSKRHAAHCCKPDARLQARSCGSSYFSLVSLTWQPMTEFLITLLGCTTAVACSWLAVLCAALV